MFHELLWRDHGDGRATWQPQGVGPEAYLNGTSQGSTSEDTRKDSHIRGRSRLFMEYQGWVGGFVRNDGFGELWLSLQGGGDIFWRIWKPRPLVGELYCR